MNDTTSMVTLTGLALDPQAVVGSVRSVKFTLSQNCTDPATLSVAPASNMLKSTSGFTQLEVSLNNTSGLSGGLWAVCVDWSASAYVGAYVRVGSVGDFVTVGALLLAFLFLFCFLSTRLCDLLGCY